MSELPKASNPADDATPDESTAETQDTDQQPIPDDPTGENPHIGDVLADPNTNGARRG